MKFRFDKKYLYWGLVGAFSIIAGILFYYILFYSESLSNADYRRPDSCISDDSGHEYD